MKFVVGERVRIYSDDRQLAVYYGKDIYIGKVIRIKGDGKLRVELDGTASQDSEGHNNYKDFWPQQCRRLMKKKRREIWVNEYGPDLDYNNLCAYETKAIAGLHSTNGLIRTACFREVKK